MIVDSVIQFLETMGRDDFGASTSGEEYVLAVQALEIDEASKQALLARDGKQIGRLLGARESMYCSLALPGDDDQKEESPVVPDDGNEPPDQDADK